MAALLHKGRRPWGDCANIDSLLNLIGVWRCAATRPTLKLACRRLRLRRLTWARAASVVEAAGSAQALAPPLGLASCTSGESCALHQRACPEKKDGIRKQVPLQVSKCRELKVRETALPAKPRQKISSGDIPNSTRSRRTRGTVLEPQWNPGGTPVEPWWNPGGTLVENWWKTGGTLVEPYLRGPRTTPKPTWAETPKLSAVGEEKKMKKESMSGQGTVLACKPGHRGKGLNLSD